MKHAPLKSFVPAAIAGLVITIAAPAGAQPVNLRPPGADASTGNMAPIAPRPPVATPDSSSAPAITNQAPAEGGGAASAPPPGPTITYALLPGHWTLRGARYVWVPPETVPRRVDAAPFVPGRYVWDDGAWVWAPAHRAD